MLFSSLSSASLAFSDMAFPYTMKAYGGYSLSETSMNSPSNVDTSGYKLGGQVSSTPTSNIHLAVESHHSDGTLKGDGATANLSNTSSDVEGDYFLANIFSWCSSR